MEELVDKIIICDFEDIPFDDFPVDERFGLIVKKNNVKYEFLINLKSDADKLICLGSGALNGDDLERFELKPRFHRQSWNFNSSTIFYNDPTRYLDKNLLGGWGIGTPDEWYLEVIKDILVKISDYFNYPHENILFYGSSLGGFMSIQLATLVKDSTALADVPQLTFENAKYWQKVKPILFPDFSDEYIYENFKHRLNVLDLMKKEKYIPNLIMVFNAGEVDINEHYVHFFKELSKLNNLNDNFIKIVINPIDEHKFLDMPNSLCMIEEASKKNLLRFNNEIYTSELYNMNQFLNSKVEGLEFEKVDLINRIKELELQNSEMLKKLYDLKYNGD